MSNHKQPATPSPDLSIIITAHAEGILLHKTLASVRRAIKPLAKKGVTTEIIIHADNPKPQTTEYLDVNRTALADTLIFTNSFGDLGSSRNFAVNKAHGKYITFIDADDLVSEQWYVRAYEFLEAHTFGDYIAHTESTVEFGSSDSVIIKHGEINKATDTLLSVFANRWNSIIMAPRELLIEEPYAPNSPGYGYEDWHLNCRFINKDVHNVLIPKTAIFVRRKDAESEWLRQKISRSVLHANPLFSFDAIRALPITSVEDSHSDAARVILSPSSAQHMRQKMGPVIKRVPGIDRYARKLYHMARAVKQAQASQSDAAHIPEWLSREWRAMHAIEKQVFPTDQLMVSVPIYDSLTPDHYKTAAAFKELINHTTHNTYDYILFVPWLIKGGADLFAVNYANTIQSLRAKKNVLVIATLPSPSERASMLEGVDFIPFGTITAGLSQDIQFRLLEQLIENSGAQYVHLLNSELGYDFVVSHENYWRATGKKLVVTSFSQSTDETGRLFGYSHTHVPKVYELASCVTTDNTAVAKMWVSEYGFDPKKILVHHQHIAAPKLSIPTRPLAKGALRVLWAARLCPEKQPALVAEIGRLVRDLDIHIDMYGHPDHGFDLSFLNSLPSNVQYKGSYDGFFTLPLETYDAYLYTSLFDGMPNAILEAASSKLPIVSAAVGGVPDFIDDHTSGLLAPELDNAQQYADALRDLYNHPENLAAYSQRLSAQLEANHSHESYEASVKAMLKQISY